MKLNILKLLLALICISFLTNCKGKQRKNIEQIITQVENEIKIDLPSHLSVEYSEDYAIGDYSEMISIYFDSTSFAQLYDSIEKRFNKTRLESIGIRGNWLEFQSGFRLELSDSEFHTSTTIFIFKEDMFLKYLYVEE